MECGNILDKELSLCRVILFNKYPVLFLRVELFDQCRIGINKNNMQSVGRKNAAYKGSPYITSSENYRFTQNFLLSVF